MSAFGGGRVSSDAKSLPAGSASAPDDLPAEIERRFRTGEWLTAFELLRSADEAGGLDGPALERYATAAYMIGREDAFADLMQRAFDAHCGAKADMRAARVAFWLGLTLMFRGEFGQGSGWLARAGRLVEEHGADCVERGYVLLPRAEQSLSSGDLAEAERLSVDAVGIGSRFADEDLLAIARHLLGRCRLLAGRMTDGLGLLDEAMVAVTTGRVSPMVTGLIYCSVIDICQTFHIYQRAKEWTDALSGWCASQPELVSFTDRCLIHRSEILIFDGKWEAAAAEAARASSRLQRSPARHRAAPAVYLEGEVHRLCGRFAAAQKSYRTAHQLGHDPQPGFALMRLEQGDLQSATSAIERSLSALRDDLGRMHLLPAAIEIALGAGDIGAAQAHCAELTRLSHSFPSTLVEAMLSEATGDVSFATAGPAAALPEFRRSAEIWRTLGIPYRLAHVRLKTGRACAVLGDTEGARAEMEAARDGFAELGAVPDAKKAEAALRGLRKTGQGGLLTPRQTEVLALIAQGLTNRDIAERLGLSRRTIDRHVGDILTRTGVPTRAAATAYALTRGLIGPPATE